MDPASTNDPNYAPDITIELAGRTFTFQPVIAEMKLLQKRCGGLVHLADKLRSLTVTLEELAAIIYYGCGAEREKVIPINAIEEIIFEKGMLNFVKPCADFLSRLLVDGPRGASRPKQEPSEKKA